MKFKVNNSTIQKVLSVATVVIAGIAAVGNTLTEQKKEKEFEEMKKAISELQNK